MIFSNYNSKPKFKLITLFMLLVTNFYLISQLSYANNKIDTKSHEVQEFINNTAKKHKTLNKKYITDALNKANHNQDVIDRIKKPYEALPWSKYKNFFITNDRANQGIDFWNKHSDTLKKAEQKYGVPPEVIVAIIGVETNYGKNKGKFPVLDSLATLSFNYPPRARFFKSELEQFLLLTKEENWEPTKIYGSYAGALGYPQFISSSLRHYAVDFNNDGHRDILNNPEDAIGSVANYFYKHGWQKGFPITIQANKDSNKFRNLMYIKSLKPKFKISTLENFGVKVSNKEKDVISNLKNKKETLVSLVELTHQKDKDDSTNPNAEYWLGLNNFYVITRYNLSNNYAMAVYQLSNKLRQKYNEQYLAGK